MWLDTSVPTLDFEDGKSWCPDSPQTKKLIKMEWSIFQDIKLLLQGLQGFGALGPSGRLTAPVPWGRLKAWDCSHALGGSCGHALQHLQLVSQGGQLTTEDSGIWGDARGSKERSRWTVVECWCGANGHFAFLSAVVMVTIVSFLWLTLGHMELYGEDLMDASNFPMCAYLPALTIAMRQKPCHGEHLIRRPAGVSCGSCLFVIVLSVLSLSLSRLSPWRGFLRRPTSFPPLPLLPSWRSSSSSPFRFNLGYVVLGSTLPTPRSHRLGFEQFAVISMVVVVSAFFVVFAVSLLHCLLYPILDPLACAEHLLHA